MELSSSRTLISKIIGISFSIIMICALIFAFIVVWFDNEFGSVLITRLFYSFILVLLSILPIYLIKGAFRLVYLSIENDFAILRCGQNSINYKLAEIESHGSFTPILWDPFRICTLTRIKVNKKGYLVLNKSVFSNTKNFSDSLYEAKFLRNK